jgi:hypothetical protein
MKLFYSCCVLVAFLLLAVPARVHSQSTSEDIRNGIAYYYDLIDYLDLFSDEIDEELLTTIKPLADSSLFFLNRAMNSGTDQQKKVCGYFSINSMYEYGNALAKGGVYQVAFDELNQLREVMGNITESYFPIEYEFEGENYSVSWTVFATVKADYYELMGEICFALEKNEEAVSYYRSYLASGGTTPVQNILAYNVLLRMGKLLPDLIPSEDRVKDCYAYLEHLLSAEDFVKSLINENEGFISAEDCVNQLLTEGGKQEVGPGVDYCARAASLLAGYPEFAPLALKLYNLSFKKYRSGAQPGLIYAFMPELPAYEFSSKAETLARSRFAADKDMAEFVGLSATAEMAATAFDASYKNSDCSKLERVADCYAFWNKPDEQRKYKKLAESCREEKAKSDRKNERREKADNSTFNLYTGIYPIPLFASNARRDYGGVLNLVGERFGLEFSYMQVNQKKENIFDMWIREVDDTSQDDLSRWDGFYAHVQPKFISKEGTASYSYIGTLLGYARKDFAPMEVSVTNDADGMVSLAAFDPAVTQYIAMVTFGAMVLKKGFGADLYWSLGANYSTFDPGTTINRADYTISNPLLEARNESYFGFIMRAGLTIGINFGSGR